MSEGRTAKDRAIEKAVGKAEPPTSDSPLPSLEESISRFRKFYNREPSQHLIDLWKEAIEKCSNQK